MLLRELHGQLRAAILDGRLKPGVRLPATRELAATMRVSRNTAVAAYDLLLSEGYLEARRGSGTFVANLSSRHPARKAATGALPNRVEGRADDRLAAMWRAPPLPDEGPPRVGLRYDFRLGAPDKSKVAFDVWRRLSARALRSLSSQPLVDAEPHGRLALREAIATYVSFARAVSCRADDVTVTAGAQQALDLLVRILVTPGKTVVAMEDPGFLRMRSVLEAAGAKVVPVPVDREGLVVERVPREARVIYVTPSHQFPLGMAMSLQRRAELLAFAKARHAVILEDDYDSEFRFGGRPLDALQSLDTDGSVIYIGTFSKSLFPALRLGYVVAPPWAHAALGAAKQLAVGDSALLAQETLAAFIAEGHLARHVRKMRRVYAARREAMLDTFESTLGAWLDPVPTHAGLHLAAYAKGRLDADAIVRQAWQAGVGTYSLSRYYAGTTRRQGLVFGYGATPEREIVAGLKLLARVFAHRD